MPTICGAAREDDLVDELRTLAQGQGKSPSTAEIRAAVHKAGYDRALAASSLDLTTLPTVLKCMACSEFHPEKHFTNGQLDCGDERCCAVCIRRMREEEGSASPAAGASSAPGSSSAPGPPYSAGASTAGASDERSTIRSAAALDADPSLAEPEAAHAEPDVPLPAWGIEEYLPEVQATTSRRPISRGDILELWLPKGSRSHDRRLWVARYASDGTFLPERLAFSTPAWIDHQLKSAGGWIAVKAAANQMLLHEGRQVCLNKPALVEELLPPHLRGEAPRAGPARTGNSYAAVARPAARGPSDRKVLIFVYAPADAKSVRIEEPKHVGSGVVDLDHVHGCFWRTPSALPCGPTGFQYQVCVGRAGVVWGQRTERGDSRRVAGRRFDSPHVEDVIDFGDSHGSEDYTQQQRASLMAVSLIESVKTSSDDAVRRLSEVLDSLVQGSPNANFSIAATTLMQSALLCARTQVAQPPCQPPLRILVPMSAMLSCSRHSQSGWQVRSFSLCSVSSAMAGVCRSTPNSS